MVSLVPRQVLCSRTILEVLSFVPQTSPRNKREADEATVPSATPAKSRKITIQLVSCTVDQDETGQSAATSNDSLSEESNNPSTSSSDATLASPSHINKDQRVGQMGNDRLAPKCEKKEEIPANKTALYPILEVEEPEIEEGAKEGDQQGQPNHIGIRENEENRPRCTKVPKKVRMSFMQGRGRRHLHIPRRTLAGFTIKLSSPLEIEEWLMEEREAHRAALRELRAAHNMHSLSGLVGPMEEGNGREVSSVNATLSYNRVQAETNAHLHNQERLLINAYDHLHMVIWEVVAEGSCRNTIVEQLNESFRHVQKVIWMERNEEEATRLIAKIGECSRVMQRQAATVAH